MCSVSDGPSLSKNTSSKSPTYSFVGCSAIYPFFVVAPQTNTALWTGVMVSQEDDGGPSNGVVGSFYDFFASAGLKFSSFGTDFLLGLGIDSLFQAAWFVFASWVFVQASFAV